ncbi:MAG: hypothetical protein U1F87_12165 [Kiritimatiellia bacterium]
MLVTAKDGVLLTAITALGEQAQALVAKLGLEYPRREAALLRSQ